MQWLPCLLRFQLRCLAVQQLERYLTTTVSMKPSTPCHRNMHPTSWYRQLLKISLVPCSVFSAYYDSNCVLCQCSSRNTISGLSQHDLILLDFSLPESAVHQVRVLLTWVQCRTYSGQWFYKWRNPHQSRNMFLFCDHWLWMLVIFLDLGSHLNNTYSGQMFSLRKTKLKFQIVLLFWVFALFISGNWPHLVTHIWN
jgi:hypothetical protein